MQTLPLITLVRMLKSFLGDEWTCGTKDEKISWINHYRKVENETNEQIQRHGSVEAWYESGEGRLI